MKAKRRPTGKPFLTKQGAQRAIELATAIATREPIASADRHWLHDLLLMLASDALEHRAAHRKAGDPERDFFAAMDYILTKESRRKEASAAARLAVQTVVAKRWKITPPALGQIVRRNRANVQTILSGSTATRDAWLKVVATHRDRSVRS